MSPGRIWSAGKFFRPRFGCLIAPVPIIQMLIVFPHWTQLPGPVAAP